MPTGDVTAHLLDSARGANGDGQSLRLDLSDPDAQTRVPVRSDQLVGIEP